MKKNYFFQSVFFFVLTGLILDAVWSDQSAQVVPVVTTQESEKPENPSEKKSGTTDSTDEMNLSVQGLRLQPRCKKENWTEGMPKMEGRVFQGEMTTDCSVVLESRPGNLVALEENLVKEFMRDAVDVHQAPQSTAEGTTLEVTRKYQFAKVELVARQVLTIQRLEDQTLQLVGITREFIEGKANSAKMVGQDWKFSVQRGTNTNGEFSVNLQLAAKVEKPALAPQGLFMNKAKAVSSEAFQFFVERTLTDLDKGL